MLRGDLDWITLKALERPRPQVLPLLELAAISVAICATNLSLRGPYTLVYRTKKYVRRHKFGVAAQPALRRCCWSFSRGGAINLHDLDHAGLADRVTVYDRRCSKVSNPSEARGNAVWRARFWINPRRYRHRPAKGSGVAG